MYRLLAALLLSLAVSGCAFFTPRPPAPPPPPAEIIMGADGILERGTHLYIARAPVSNENEPGAKVFGLSLENACREVLEPYAATITVAKKVETRTVALASARARKARYLVMPSMDTARINTYEEPPTADMALYVSIFEVPTGKHVLMRYIDVSTRGSSMSSGKELLRSTLAETMLLLFQ